MKYYSPNDRMHFGKCRGELLSDIYKFNPRYIEWLVKYNSEFCINISDFNESVKPTPYIAKKGMWIKVEANFVKEGKSYLESGGKLPETEFRFSAETISILKQKVNGVYITPLYKHIKDATDSDFAI